jgi:putative ABC transport system substrate-binding protein
MRRREFLGALGSAAAVWPLVARAQQPAVPVIGYLTSVELDPKALAAFRLGLKDVGFVEGGNVAIEYRSAHGEYDQLAALAVELIQRRVTLIATTGGSPPVRAAKAASGTIPIVFTGNFDPVELGFVASLNKPGGNITGVSALGIELSSKRLELLHEFVPSASTIAVLLNPTNSGDEAALRRLRPAAEALGVQLQVFHASAEADFEAAFAAITRVGAGGLVIASDPLFNTHEEELATQALRHAVPVVYQYREFAAAGGLMSYGIGDRQTDNPRIQGTYAGRILKGEKPSDLPVQQATKLGLFINLKAATALGLTVPPNLLARADEVFE